MAFTDTSFNKNTQIIIISINGIQLSETNENILPKYFQQDWILSSNPPNLFGFSFTSTIVGLNQEVAVTWLIYPIVAIFTAWRTDWLCSESMHFSVLLYFLQLWLLLLHYSFIDWRMRFSCHLLEAMILLSINIGRGWNARVYRRLIIEEKMKKGENHVEIFDYFILRAIKHK